MINVFFDCEFTHLQQPLDPEPPGLISIGCVGEEGGKRFYAENADFQFELCSDFTKEIVLPLLEGGDFSMSYNLLAKRLRAWVESFDGEIKFWTDAPGFDWPIVQHLFDCHGWPKNLRKECAPLQFASAIQNLRLRAAVDDAFATFKPPLRRHHALDDAIANRHAFRVATVRTF